MDAIKSQIKCEYIEDLDLIEEELVVYLQRLTAVQINLRQANSAMLDIIKEKDFEKEKEELADYENI